MTETPTFGPTASPAKSGRDIISPAFQDRPPPPGPPTSFESPITKLDGGDFSQPSPSTNEESFRISSDHQSVVLGSPPAGNSCSAISMGRPVDDSEQLFTSGSKTPHPSDCFKMSEPVTPQPSTAPSKLNYDRNLSLGGFPDTHQTRDIRPFDKIDPLDNGQNLSQSEQSRSSQPLDSVDPTSTSRLSSTFSSPPSSDVCCSSPSKLDYEILLRYVCPLKIIKMHILPPFSQRMLHESEEKGVLELRKHLEPSFCAKKTEDITIFEPDCDRLIESRIRMLLSRFLKYAGMDPKLAAEFVRETCRWMSYEGYVSLSYNFVSPCLYESGFELITSTKQRLPNTPRLFVISGQARQLKSILMRAVIAYWLFRVCCDTTISIEIDCSQTELNTIKLILENIFIVFERLALEPTELIMANLEGTDCAGGTVAIPPILLTKDKTPQYWSRFMKHARIDRLTRDSSSPYTAFESEVEVNDIPNAKNNILPVYDSKATEDLESEIMLSHAMTETQWPIEKYRVLRLSFSAIYSYKPMTQPPVWRGSGIDSSVVSTDTECTKVGDAFEQWLRSLIIHEICIPIKITSNTMFDEQQGSASVYNNGVWETYIFGRDKAGRINICINDLTLMNLEFIGFLIIWTYQTLLKMPIGRCELINILINYHGLTLLNKRLSQLLQFLNTFYNSCINKIYIFNTTFINRTVLQTAIKGSRQGGGGVSVNNSSESGANRKTIPVIIVTEDIRSEISSQQRQYQFGIGKQRVKMSSTGTNLPMAFFPSRN